MKYGLNIRPDAALDFVSLGALVHRLDPGIVPFRKATEFRIHVSGGEFNVAANLADCFGLKTGVATAMVDYPIGDLIAERVRAMGVTPFYKRFKHDGVNGPNIATVYSDRGHGVRAPVVFYNRSNEAAAQLKPGDFDWKAIFAGGVRWFHSGGIFAALSATTCETIIDGMQAAKAAGAVISFDLELPGQALEPLGRRGEGAAIVRRIVENVDVLIGNEEDLQMGLGVHGPEVAASSKLDPSTFFRMIGDVTEKFPNIKVVATTLREVQSTNRHVWGAVFWINGKTYVSPTCEVDVFDRVGGGDGFAAGFFYGLIAGRAGGSRRCSWAGRTAPWSPPSRAIPPCRRSSRSARSPRAGRRASSAERTVLVTIGAAAGRPRSCTALPLHVAPAHEADDDDGDDEHDGGEVHQRRPAELVFQAPASGGATMFAACEKK